jgi:hypothetical protein
MSLFFCAGERLNVTTEVRGSEGAQGDLGAGAVEVGVILSQG